jgi:PleD family two-component response regulator
MPGMNGIQLCAEVRKSSSIPFIFYTARGSEEVASAAFSTGVDDYIRKERDLSHYQILARRIRHSVEGRRIKELYRASVEGSRDGLAIIQGLSIVYAN